MDSDDVLLRLEEMDWSGAEVDYSPGPRRILFSVPLPSDLAEKLFDAATDRGMNPIELVQDLLKRGLAG